jgi:hypothetical protein
MSDVGSPGKTTTTPAAAAGAAAGAGLVAAAEMKEQEALVAAGSPSLGFSNIFLLHHLRFKPA